MTIDTSVGDFIGEATASDQSGLHKFRRVPAIRSKRDPDTFTNHHQNDDGTIGPRVTEAEATHFLCHHFWVEEKRP